MATQEFNLDECFDENGVFYYNFGTDDTSVQFLLSLIPDENETDPPTVEIQEVRGFTDPQIRELRGEIEDLTETDYYEQWFDFPNLIFRVNDYLYSRTGEDAFRDFDREKKEAEKEKARKERELQKKLEKEKELEEKVSKQRTAVMARFSAQVKAMNYTQKQQMRARLELERRRREEQEQAMLQQLSSKSRQEKIRTVQTVLYGRGKLERPDPELFSTDNGYLLENLEVAYHDRVTMFSQTYSKIKRVPFTLGELGHLVELNLSFNGITQMPVAIRNLVNLQKLILCDNQITLLPPIDTLVNLRVLDVRKNALTLLPDFESLVSLQSLSADENQIKVVSNSIAECKALHYINLANNKLSLLPPEIGNLPKLEVLKLINNPMRMIPAEIYHQGTEHVLNYLKTYIPSTTLAQSLFRDEIMKLVNNSDYSDIILKMANESYPAHRIIIKYRSSKLNDIIQKKIEAAKAGAEPMDKDLEGRWIVPIDEIPNAEYGKMLLNYIYGDTLRFEFKQESVRQDLKENDLIPALKKLLTHEEELAEIQRRKELQAEIEKKASWAENWGLPRLKALVEQSFWPAKEVPASTFEEELRKARFDNSVHKPKSEPLNEIKFLIEGEIVVAHKTLLAARSTYFHRMFTSGLKEAQMEVIELQDIPRVVFDYILEYCYTNDIEKVDGEYAIELLVKSRVYGLDRLLEIIETIVGYSIDAENVGCIYEVAMLYKCKKLKRACVYFLLSNFNAVKSYESWQELSDEVKDKIFKKAEEWGVALK
jgi:hypothetical protein